MFCPIMGRLKGFPAGAAPGAGPSPNSAIRDKYYEVAVVGVKGGRGGCSD